MDKKKPHRNVVITAIVCLTLLECMALFKGINGTLFTGIAVVIAGLAGWVAPELKLK